MVEVVVTVEVLIEVEPLPVDTVFVTVDSKDE